LVKVASALELTTAQLGSPHSEWRSAISLAVFNALRFFGYGIH
jgi:hypothetical protein